MVTRQSQTQKIVIGPSKTKVKAKPQKPVKTKRPTKVKPKKKKRAVGVGQRQSQSVNITLEGTKPSIFGAPFTYAPPFRPPPPPGPQSPFYQPPPQAPEGFVRTSDLSEIARKITALEQQTGLLNTKTVDTASQAQVPEDTPAPAAPAAPAAAPATPTASPIPVRGFAADAPVFDQQSIWRGEGDVEVEEPLPGLPVDLVDPYAHEHEMDAQEMEDEAEAPPVAEAAPAPEVAAYPPPAPARDGDALPPGIFAERVNFLVGQREQLNSDIRQVGGLLNALDTPRDPTIRVPPDYFDSDFGSGPIEKRYKPL